MKKYLQDVVDATKKFKDYNAQADKCKFSCSGVEYVATTILSSHAIPKSVDDHGLPPFFVFCP